MSVDNQLPQTLQEAQEYAATFGVVLTAADYRKIEALKDTALVDMSTVKVSLPQRIVERFNRYYPEVLHFLAGIGDTAISGIQTTALALGLPVLLVLVLVVEHSRVKYGIGLFESHPALADMGAALLVLTNTVLEFLIYHLEYKHGYVEDRRVRGSLRLYGRNMAYWLGIGRGWQEQRLSPAQRYKGLQRIVTAVILVLATAGSMTDVIARQTGTWYEALVDIATKSSLSEMSTWIGGLLFAVAAVLIAQVVTQYAAIRAREIMTGMNVHTQRQTPAQEAEARAIQYVLAKTAKKAEERSFTERTNERTQRKGIQSVYSVNERMNEYAFTPPDGVHSQNGNGHSERTANGGYRKTMNARDYAREYFADPNHAGHINHSLDTLEKEISAWAGVKVGRTTIHNVRKELEQAMVS